MFRHLLTQRAPTLRVEIDSAGTANYHAGAAPDLRSQRAALRRGIDISGLRARQVVAADFARFDLILAMDRDNLKELLALKPKDSRAVVKLFLEYAPDSTSLEVPDPYDRGARSFEEVLDLTSAASLGLIGWLQQQQLA